MRDYDMLSSKQAEVAQSDPTQLTVRQRLERHLYSLEKEAGLVQKAIAALDNNPGAEELLDALRKVGI